ncbi:NAD(P)-dependent oxidoreductase [Streptomyces avermitilis]|uniref:NAD(P)-dependent oxidoreductase n=1 Tax=Streptomyces avermitilis TaxID=33903 RepID=UPI003826B2EA
MTKTPDTTTHHSALVPGSTPACGPVAFVGLGVMGLPMARNIAAAGIDLRVHDASPQACDRARIHGLKVSGELAQALEGASTVITMLPDTPHVRQVVRGPDGVLARCTQGTVVVDMSTISPLATQELAAELADRQLALVDAPVSGGVRAAVSGTLSIMAGGAPDALARVRPVLETMGSATYVGPAGSGQVVKACNQVAVALTIQAACEAFTLGSRFGVQPQVLREALLGGAASSWVLEHLAPQMIDGDDSAGFRIALQVKDLRIAVDAAAGQGMPLPGASGALQLYLEAMAHGQQADGNQALARVYERIADVRIATP